MCLKGHGKVAVMSSVLIEHRATVREDYSNTGDAWRFFPHDHARSRAYRWNEGTSYFMCSLTC